MEDIILNVYHGRYGILGKVLCELIILGKCDKELNPMLECDSFTCKALQLVNVYDCTDNSSQTYEDG